VLHPVFSDDLTLDDFRMLSNLNHLLEDLGLKLEATHVAIVSHHCQNVSDNGKVEVPVED
jgi:hypothetical protein